MTSINTHACAELEMRLRSEKRDQERLGRTLRGSRSGPDEGLPRQGWLVPPAHRGRLTEDGPPALQALISSSPAPINGTLI